MRIEGRGKNKGRAHETWGSLTHASSLTNVGPQVEIYCSQAFCIACLRRDCKPSLKRTGYGASGRRAR